MIEGTEISPPSSVVGRPSSVLRPPPFESPAVASHPLRVIGPPTLRVSLLTGGGDKPYALGMAEALTSAGVLVDFIGSDDLAVQEVLGNARINFFNLRGDQRPEAGRITKVLRVLRYYGRLIRYAAGSKASIFHVLWNNKLEYFDRTVLTFYYKLLGRRVVFTAHNVNAAKRDGDDNWLNRLTLRIQYRLVDHIFVHTSNARDEMIADLGVSASKITVIPFGINRTAPDTALTPGGARERLGIGMTEKTLLFFGNIAPYKGLKFLIDAFAKLAGEREDYRLIIAGRPKGTDRYWEEQKRALARHGIEQRVTARILFIPDEETEVFFKAADVLILPYTHVFQSGVLFLGYAFGLPVIAADVGSLRDEIVEGKTGFVFKPKSTADLVDKIAYYFGSELFRNLEMRRAEIRSYANERYSWDKVTLVTMAVYRDLVSEPRRGDTAQGSSPAPVTESRGTTD